MWAQHEECREEARQYTVLLSATAEVDRQAALSGKESGPCSIVPRKGALRPGEHIGRDKKAMAYAAREGQGNASGRQATGRCVGAAQTLTLHPSTSHRRMANAAE